MNERIKEFIKKQTCASICIINEKGNPHCFSCFYAFNSLDKLLYFKSSPDSYHLNLIKSNPGIAGTILPDKLNKLMIKGIQLQGQVLEHHHPMAKDATVNYHKKFPFAMTIKGDVLTIHLTDIKMTDNSFGVGKKILWKINE